MVCALLVHAPGFSWSKASQRFGTRFTARARAVLLTRCRQYGTLSGHPKWAEKAGVGKRGQTAGIARDCKGELSDSCSLIHIPVGLGLLPMAEGLRDASEGSSICGLGLSLCFGEAEGYVWGLDLRSGPLGLDPRGNSGVGFRAGLGSSTPPFRIQSPRVVLVQVWIQARSTSAPATTILPPSSRVLLRIGERIWCSSRTECWTRCLRSTACS